MIRERVRSSPELVERFNGEPMAEVIGILRSGVSLAEARARCERIAEEVRAEFDNPEYRITWSRAVPARK
jgi:multidrug efflux pump subunit AcrB